MALTPLTNGMSGSDCRTNINASFTQVDANTTKLAGIEAGADVTDAGNVGSSIHGATAKTTPVDGDTVPLIDSAASNVLKKVTWANIKATLKTYFDTLYSTFTNPMSASGDIIYGGTAGAGTRLAKGANGQVLTLASGLPSWATPSGGSISTPKVYHVESDGNDSTGDGSINAPYLTGTKAELVAYTAGVPCTIHFGVGTFYITVTTRPIFADVTFFGCGINSTALIINNSPPTITDGNGTDGFLNTIKSYDINLSVYTNGGQASDFSGVYGLSGGNASNLTVIGRGKISATCAGGFSDSGSYTGTGGPGGSGGQLTIQGDWDVWSAVTAGGAGDAGAGADGSNIFDGCTLTNVALSTNLTNPVLSLARCSYTATNVTSITNDRGGNALY